MTNWKAGMKAVCVSNGFGFDHDSIIRPEQHKVYTVRNVTIGCDGIPGLQFEEIINRKYNFSEGFLEPAYDERSFRPLNPLSEQMDRIEREQKVETIETVEA